MIETTIEVNIKAFYDLVLLDYIRSVLDLLQSGVNPRTVDKYGRTPLHVASTKTDVAIGKCLKVRG